MEHRKCIVESKVSWTFVCVLPLLILSGSVALGQIFLQQLSSISDEAIFDPKKLKTCNVLELG
jgi:predicted membrane-bound mannosyltransferase